MSDSTTFESRLATALGRYADLAPVQLDAAALAREVASRRPAHSRSSAHPEGRRVARLIVALVVVLLLATAVVVVGSRLLEQRPVPPSLVPAGSLKSTVHNPSAHALGDGRVLIIGSSGDQVIAAFFDPRTGESREFAVTNFATGVGPALPLPDGRIIVSGIVDSSASDPPTIGILDPATGAVALAGKMLANRFSEAQVVLADGRVLISGGLDVTGSTSAILASVEVFDPDTATFSPLAPLLQPRMRHSMLALGDGRVLVVGGSGVAGSDVLEVEVYDPVTGRSTIVGTIGPGRGLTAGPPVLLSDGRVLIPGGAIAGGGCGGVEGARQAMYVFDPTTNKVVPRRPLLHFVEGAVATIDRRVVVFGLSTAVPGGCDSGGEPLLYPWLGVYDPETGTTVETADPTTGIETLHVRIDHQYVAGATLPDGRIALIADDFNRPVDNPIDLFTLGR